MLPATVITVSLYLFASAFALAGAHPLAMALFPAPVAYFWSASRFRSSLGLVACAGLAAFTAGLTVTGVALYVVTAMIGVVMGMAIQRRWPFGWCVAAGTAAAFAISGGFLLLSWADFRESWTAFSNTMIQQLEQNPEGYSKESVEAFTETMRWTDLHWEYLSAGLLFGMAFLFVLICMGLVSRRLRLRRPGAEPPGGFRVMRTPDWLVWLAIALFGVWYIDRQWPAEALRIISWNGAVALVFVYTINGISILLYGLNAFSAGPMVVGVTILLLFWLGAQPMLCAVGFFDTWWDLRSRFDRWAELRRLRNRPDDRDL